MANIASELRRVVVDESAQATHELVAGASGYSVAVVAAALTAAGDVVATFRDESEVLAPFRLIDGVPLTLPDSSGGWIRTAGGSALSLQLGAAVAVRGVVLYRLIPSHMEL